MSNSSIQQLKDEVERRVALAIIPVLFDKVKQFHAHRYSRSFYMCDCCYCTLKRRASAEIAATRRELRNKKINSFRSQLEEAFNKI